MNHKMDQDEIFVKGLKINSLVLTPAGQDNYDDEFIIGPDGMSYARNRVLSRHHIIKWEFKTNDEAFQRKWLSIANDLSKLDWPESDFVFDHKPEKPFGTDTSTTMVIKKENGWRFMGIEFYGHPLVGAKKPVIAILKKIAALIPDYWAKPYVLTNLL